MVEVQIDRDLLPCYLSLAKNYTRFLPEVVFNFSSTRTMKIYQFVSHWQDKPKKSVYIEEMRSFLKLGNIYSHSSDFRTRVLEPAYKDLKENADVWFEIKEPIKEDRKVIGWKISIHKKEELEKAIPKIKEVPRTEKEQKAFQKLREHFNIGAIQTNKILDQVPEKDIYKTLYDIQCLHASGKVANIGAYTLKVFKEKFDIQL
jgi:plasmid replication initiation protein